MQKTKWVMDVFLFALMLFTAASMGANHEQNLIRALVILVSFVYASLRYVLSKGLMISKNIDLILLFWLVTFFTIYFIYGNLYYVNRNTFGGNDTTGVLLLFVITSLLFVALQETNELYGYMKNVYLTAMLMYMSYLIWLFSQMSLLDLAGIYRLGDPIDGEFIINGNSNNIAINIGCFIAPILFELLNKKKIIYLLPSLLGVTFILFTGSKKGVVMVLLYFILFYGFARGVKLKKILFLIALLGALVGVILNVEALYLIVGHRFMDFIDVFLFGDTSIKSVSTDLRASMYKVGLELWLDHPTFGGGLGYFQAFSGFGLYSHNTYIELLVSFGILGFVVYYSYPIYVLVKMFLCKKRKEYLYFIGVIVISLFVDSAAVRFYDYISWVNYVFIFSILKIPYKTIGK